MLPKDARGAFVLKLILAAFRLILAEVETHFRFPSL